MCAARDSIQQPDLSSHGARYLFVNMVCTNLTVCHLVCAMHQAHSKER
jgi:hypothetical protein